MKRCSGTDVGLLMLAALVVVAASLLPAAESVTCSPYELLPCSGAIFGGAGSPSEACCSKLWEQQPCLCGYLRDPNLRSYVNSPNARRVSAVCRVPYPRC